MDNLKNLDDYTPNQRKAVSKALSQTNVQLLWIGTKFILGLFLANTVSIAVGHALLQDNINVLLGYQVLCVITNAIFMGRYLTSKLDQSNDMLRDKIKEILKK